MSTSCSRRRSPRCTRAGRRSRPCTSTGSPTDLCGAARPTHFDGVATVVTKLFAIVGPCAAFFGRKDAQQLAVIARLVEDLNLPVEVVGCPIVREPDGLALSSRNAYLSAEQRRAALVLSRALAAAARRGRAGERDAAALVDLVRGLVAAEPAVDARVRRGPRRARAHARSTCSTATCCSRSRPGSATTRLIDNVTLSVRGAEVHVDLGKPSCIRPTQLCSEGAST